MNKDETLKLAITALKNCIVYNYHGSPADLAPKQKPLSDDEIEAIVQYPWGDGREFARAIEQAHGIGKK